MRILKSTCLCIVLIAFSKIAMAQDFEFKIPITQQTSGSYHIAGTVEHSDEIEFLVDTGAGMVVLAERTFKSLKQVASRKPSRRIAVRMADGRSKAVNVYTVQRLVLGEECNVGPLEVAVIPGATKNILGMDVLQKAAPFAFYTSPPSLALSACSELGASLAQSNDAEPQPTLTQLISAAYSE